LPKIIEINQRFGSRNNFALVSVTKDEGEYMAGLRKLIEENSISYPVLWLGEDKVLQQKLSRFASGIPATYLVTPGGCILASVQIGDEFISVLSDLLEYKGDIHPVTISAAPSWQKNKSLQITLSCDNPYEKSMPLQCRAGYSTREFDPKYDYDNTGEPNVSRWIDYKSSLLEGLMLAPGVHKLAIQIPYNAKAETYQCSVSAVIPGTESFGGGQGLGVSTSVFEWASSSTY
jgi:hypothetical protein